MYKREYVLEAWKTKRNGKIIVMPYVFKDITAVIEDIEYFFNYENDKLNIL